MNKEQINSPTTIKEFVKKIKFFSIENIFKCLLTLLVAYFICTFILVHTKGYEITEIGTLNVDNKGNTTVFFGVDTDEFDLKLTTLHIKNEIIQKDKLKSGDKVKCVIHAQRKLFIAYGEERKWTSYEIKEISKLEP